MPYCCVPGCRSRYNRKVEVKRYFTPPKEKDLFVKWARAIPGKDRQLSLRSRICDVHFSEDLIVKSDRFIVAGENVEIPRVRWKLKPGAVPHIFPNLPKYFSNQLKTRKPPRRPQHQVTTKGRNNNEDTRGEKSVAVCEGQDVVMESGTAAVLTRDHEMYTKLEVKEELLYSDTKPTNVKLECDENEMVPVSSVNIMEHTNVTVIPYEIQTKTERKEDPKCKETIVTNIKLESEEQCVLNVNLRNEIIPVSSGSLMESRTISNYGCEFHTEIEIKQEPEIKLESEASSVLDCPAFEIDIETERRESSWCPGVTSHVATSESYVLPHSYLEDDAKDVALNVNGRNRELLTERPRLQMESKSISPFAFVGTEPFQFEECDEIIDSEHPQSLISDSNSKEKSRKQEETFKEQCLICELITNCLRTTLWDDLAGVA